MTRKINESPYLQRKHDLAALARVDPVIALDEYVAPQPQSAEIHGELAGIGHGVEVRGEDRRQALVDLEEGPAAGRLEQRHPQDGQVRQVQGRGTDAQRARQQAAEVLDVPGNVWAEMF